jgi:hypothetical protein
MHKPQSTTLAFEYTHVVSRRYLMQNDTAYGEMLAWKTSGPSDQFKALMDLQAVHPTCRLCQHVASRKRAQEEEAKRKSEAFPPCHCQVGSNLHGVFSFSPLRLHAWQSGGVSERTKRNARRRRFCQRNEPWGDESRSPLHSRFTRPFFSMCGTLAAAASMLPI